MRTVTVILIFFSVFLVSCDPTRKPVPPISITDELVVIAVRNTANFYSDSDGGYSGLTVDLVNDFARSLRLKSRFIVMQNQDQVLQAIIAKQGHLAIGLNLPKLLQRNVHTGPAFLRTQYQVAYHTNQRKPKNWQSLINANIVVPKASIYDAQLSIIKQEIPDLAWSIKNVSSDSLLKQLAKGDIKFTVSDSFRIKRAKLFHPTIKAAFTLARTTTNQWVFPKHSGNSFKIKIKKFFARIKNDGTLARLIDKHNGHLNQISAGDVYFFQKKIEQRLPVYRKYFQYAETLTEIDWRLIAALGYQESHWRPHATSPTGVRGLMMLTEKTAKRMRVKDRLNSQQSIIGGAQYLMWLKNKLPDKIKEPDRTWMALAAYNQGYGAILDARKLARRLKLNPDYWFNIKKTLPLLNQRAYYETAEYGPVRGKEAVKLAESVRAYFDILKQQFRHDPQLQAMSSVNHKRPNIE